MSRYENKSLTFPERRQRKYEVYRNEAGRFHCCILIKYVSLLQCTLLLPTLLAWFNKDVVVFNYRR